MHVSAKSDYALRALIELVRSESARPMSAEQIGREQEIPTSFLLAILADLRRGGVVRSRRGQGGGWVMARDPEDVNVAEIIRIVDGPLVSVHGKRPENVTYQRAATVLQPVWIAARSGLREVLEAVTLADLSSGQLPEDVARRSADADAWEAR